MAYALQQLINGLTLGAMYGLIAIGYTMVYGIIGMINFAHGDIFMVSAFIAVTAFTLLAAADVTADHVDLTVGEVDHADDAVDHGVADGDQGVDTAQGQTVDDLLNKFEE